MRIGTVKKIANTCLNISKTKCPSICRGWNGLYMFSMFNKFLIVLTCLDRRLCKVNILYKFFKKMYILFIKKSRISLLIMLWSGKMCCMNPKPGIDYMWCTGFGNKYLYILVYENIKTYLPFCIRLKRRSCKCGLYHGMNINTAMQYFFLL